MTKNQKTILIAVVILLLLIGGYFVWKKYGQKPVSTTNLPGIPAPSEVAKAVVDIEALNKKLAANNYSLYNMKVALTRYSVGSADYNRIYDGINKLEAENATIEAQIKGV